MQAEGDAEEGGKGVGDGVGEVNSIVKETTAEIEAHRKVLRMYTQEHAWSPQVSRYGYSL